MPAVLFDFGAMPPEVNSARLMLGPGPGPMMVVSTAYAAVAEALTAAAAGSQGSMGSLDVTWRGPAADKAQRAFRRHAVWLQDQSVVAVQAAAAAAAVSAACAAAYTTMPPLPAILANRAASATLAATNSMGQNAAALAVNEMVYMAMWFAAAATMSSYAAEAVSAAAALPAPLPAPEIVAGGGALDPGSDPLHLLADDNGGGEQRLPGPSDTGTDPVDGGDPGGNGDPSPGDPGGAGDPGDIGGGPSDPGELPPGDPASALGDVQRAGSGLADTLGEPGANAGSLEQHGFYGTSPYSSTLTALNAGLAGIGGLGLLRGGLGALSGAATGFRMPRSWPAGAGRPFGAIPAGGAAPPPARTAPRGAIAPASRMRRRTDGEQDRGSTVFVPGELPEVPVLEQAPVIGVIEYADEPADDRLADPEHPVGVIEMFSRREELQWQHS